MQALEGIAESYADGRVVDAVPLVEQMKKFGEPARQSLLVWTTSSEKGRRNLAGSLLSQWHGWRPEDVPALANGMQMNREGLLAWALFEIGTPEAIEALVEDVRGRIGGGQSEFALVRTGVATVPYLMTLLEDDDAYPAAVSILREIGDPVRVYADQWAKVVNDEREIVAKRVGAVRALQAIGRPYTATLRQALSERDIPRLQAAATLALLDARDPALVDAMPALCEEKRPAQLVGASDESIWLSYARDTGAEATAAGPKVVPCLLSPDANERLDAAVALGAIGYGRSAPELARVLRDKDWRVVFAAARSLEQISGREAASDLTAVSQTHWLPEVRRRALQTLNSLASAGATPSTGFVDSSNPTSSVLWRHPLTVDSEILDAEPYCPSSRWRWGLTEFDRPVSERMSVRVEGWRGVLFGEGRGEFGGEIRWQPDAGPQQVVHSGENLIGLEADGSGAIAAIGLNHMSFNRGKAVSLHSDDGQSWMTTEIGTLPASPTRLRSIAPGLFAVWSRGRAVVFNHQQILGLASCVPN
jgi:HEAT repeat protein